MQLQRATPRCIPLTSSGGSAAPARATAAAGVHPSRRTTVLRRFRGNDTSSEDAAAASLDHIKATTQITVFSSAPYVTGFLEAPLRDSGYEQVTFTDASLSRHTAPLADGSAVACLFVNDEADGATVARLAHGGVRLLALRCAGYDRVDLAACEAHGLQVVRVPTYAPTSVAEHAVGLMMALNRKLAQAHMRVVAGNYTLTPLVGMELKGKTVGVVGTGAIGAEACRIFQGIGMRVLAYDPHVNPAVTSLHIPYVVTLDELLPQCDVVSLHVPLLPSTQHIINKHRVSQMKPGGLLINVSRGGLVENAALVSGMESGQLGGVGLDTYEGEGSLFFTDWTDQPLNRRMAAWDRCFKLLCSYPQVLITPHSAFLTHEALAHIAATTASNIEEFLAQRPLTNAVHATSHKS